MTICKGLTGECVDCIWPSCELPTLYAQGKWPPNYPMPVTAATAAMSIYHQDGWPNTVWPYMMVKDALSYLT